MITSVDQHTINKIKGPLKFHPADTTTQGYEENTSTLSLLREEEYLQSLKTTQQFEDTTTMRDTTFGEKLPTTTYTTRGVTPSTTTSVEPVVQHIGYKVLRTTTPTERTGDPDVAQHITYRDGLS